MEKLSNSNDNLLDLSPEDFDQSADGWRKVSMEEGPQKAAELILKYISKNKEKLKKPKMGEWSNALSLLYFHAGQELASCGKDKYDEAIVAFKESYENDLVSWNAYVDATIGFLKNDKRKIESAIEAIESSSEKNKQAGNIKFVKKFLTALSEGITDYKTAYGMSE